MTSKSLIKNKVGFFVVDFSQLIQIIETGGSAKELMAYLVLRRGAGSKTISTHGANSTAVRTGMTYTSAEHALAWLAENQFIALAPESAKRRPRWKISESDNPQELPLSNSLIDGIGKGKQNPPLARIYNDLPLGKRCLLADSQMDTLMLLLQMYQNHHLAEFGGVNPKLGLFREWDAASNSYGNKYQDLPGTNAALYEITRANTTIRASFCDAALFYVEDTDERRLRFKEAFGNLKAMGLFYEVTQIWSADPLTDESAHPLYTLYVHDRHARETDPYLSKEIHETAFRLGAMDMYDEFSDCTDSANIIGTNRFRYVATKQNGAFPIGIFRLRFRPHTRDVGKGMAAEQRRVDQWAAQLKSL